MRTLEQIADSARKKNVMFCIEKRDKTKLYDGYDICLASAFDGYMSNSWATLVDFEDGNGLVFMWCDARTPTKTERMFAERLAYQCSNFHECDWTF